MVAFAAKIMILKKIDARIRTSEGEFGLRQQRTGRQYTTSGGFNRSIMGRLQ
jgi:hypothetical protein